MSSSEPAYANIPMTRIVVKPLAAASWFETSDGKELSIRHGGARWHCRRRNTRSPYYVPRADTKMNRLTKTSHSTHCPFKGDLSYFTRRG